MALHPSLASLRAVLPQRRAGEEPRAGAVGRSPDDADFSLVERAIKDGEPDLLDELDRAAIVTDVAGAVTHWNSHAERLYGWTSTEAIGREITQLIVPGTSASDAGEILDALRAGQRWQGAFTVRDRSGRTFVAEVIDAPLLDSDGHVTGIIGLSAAAGANSNPVRVARRAADARMPQPSPTLARFGKYALAAALAALTFGAMLGMQTASGGTVPLLPVVAVAYAAWTCGWRFALVVASALTVGLWVFVFPPSNSFTLSDAEDVIRLATFAVAAVLTVAVVEYVVGGMRDLRAANERLDQLLAELKGANQAKDEFLSLVSHELKTPLTLIVGNARVLRRSYSTLDAETVDESLADIANSGERLDQIVNDLLVLARLAQDTELELEPMIVARLVAELVAEHERQYPRRDVLFHETGDARPVLAHEGYLGQALRNLISNAEKYSPPDQPIEIEVVRTGHEVRIAVRDHGTGVPVAEQVAIFQPFYRSPASRTAPGVGVGLTVCQRLIEAQHGSCWVRNHPDGGAEFGIAFPAEPPSPDEGGAQPE